MEIEARAQRLPLHEALKHKGGICSLSLLLVLSTNKHNSEDVGSSKFDSTFFEFDITPSRLDPFLIEARRRTGCFMFILVLKNL